LLQPIPARGIPLKARLFHLSGNIGCFQPIRGNYGYPAAPLDGMDIAKSSRIANRARQAVRYLKSQAGLGGHGNRSGKQA